METIYFMNEKTTLDCGHFPSPSEHTSGYGVTPNGEKHCFECCGKEDRKIMIERGEITLYLSGNKVTNWPNTLNFSITNQRVGRHNIAGKRFDVWFAGPDGKKWHGVQYGENTQLCHCKRIK